MKKLFFILLMLLPLSAIANPALKAESQNPRSVHVFPSAGMFVFYATITEGAMPSCAGNHRWSLKMDKPGANEIVSIIVSAKTTGKTVSVYGDGTCNPDGFGYQISYVNYDEVI